MPRADQRSIRVLAMSFVVPRRFSRRWWLLIGVTTLVVGTVAFVLLRFRTDLELEQLIAAWLVATIIGDVIAALSMEAVAPTRLTIGPGERRFDADRPSELAVVVAKFDRNGLGKVKVRGETWRARQSAHDHEMLDIGARARVLDRDGLTLIVSAD